MLQHPVRTDFSNLFQSASTSAEQTIDSSSRASAMQIAAAKARELLKSKNINISTASSSNGNNEPNQDGEKILNF